MQPIDLNDKRKQRDDLRREIKSRVRCTDYLQKAAEHGYICPKCGTGSGKHGTAATIYNEEANTFWCFCCLKGRDNGGSDKPWDVIDIIMLSENVDYNRALEIGADAAGLSLDALESPRNDFKRSNRETVTRNEKTEHRANTEAEKPRKDRRPYYRECIKRLGDPAAVAYITGRGISMETARRCYLGYDPKSDPAESGHPTPRIIIPTTKDHYIGRSIDPATPATYQKMNAKGATPGIFNSMVLDRPGVVFVCEGAFDALSVIEAGGEAVATNSANEAGKFIVHMEKHRPAAFLVLCEDHDEAGGRWAATIRDGLERLGISFLSADISGTAKDANEALQRDRQAFIDTVKQTIEKARARA